MDTSLWLWGLVIADTRSETATFGILMST